MEIAERTVNDVTILDLKGKMTLGEGDELLKDRINSMLAAGRKKLLINLAGVPYIDSEGLGEVVRTYTTVSRQGGSHKLHNLTKRIEDLLSITKLLTVFDTYESEADAVKSFSAERHYAARQGAFDIAGPRNAGRRRHARVEAIPRAEPARVAQAGAVDQEPGRVRCADLRA
jgi:anti-sigma B factor antagonist